MAAILLAEDSPTHATLIQRLLEDAGHDVICVADGQQAFDGIQVDRPDLVVTDLQMPRINGVELVTQIAEQFPMLPSIVVTARGSESLAVDALAKGATNFVPKDSMAKLLTRTVRQTIQLARLDASIDSYSQQSLPFEWTAHLHSDPLKTDPIVWAVVQTMAAADLLGPTQRLRVGIATMSGLFNAICFGNLQLTDDDKFIGQVLSDDPACSETFSERFKGTPASKLETVVRVSIGDRDTRIAIRHTGRGRAARLRPVPGTPESFEIEHSRRLMLITSFMDDVMFRHDATEMVMVKNHG